MPYCAADDGEMIYYTDVGKDQPLFFIHGWMSDGLDFEKNVAFFSKKFRCVSMDIRGHGFSGRIEKNLNLNQVAKDVHIIIQILNLKNPILIGHSMGAVVIFSYISQYQTNSLKGICIIDQLPKLLQDNDWKYGVEREAANIRKLKKTINDQFPTFVKGVAKQSSAMERTIRNMSKQAIITYFKELCSYDYRTLMTEIDIPVLCLLKREAQLTSNPLGEWYLKNISNCTFVEFRKSGHWIFKDEEEKFNASLEKFIQQI